MPFKMTEPTKHSKSGRYRVRLAIPAEFRATAKALYGVGAEFTENLNTSDYREARTFAPIALARLTAKLELVKGMHSGNMKSLSQRELRALAGQWYREAVAANEDNPGSYGGWEAHRDELLDARTFPEGDPDSGKQPDFEPTAKNLKEARTLLSAKGLVVHEASEAALAVALWEARLHYSGLMMRRASGDYGPDPFVGSIAVLPAEWPAPQAGQDAAPSASTTEILRGWARDAGHDPDAKPTPRAYYDRQRTAARLTAFLRHDAVAAITKADAVRWKANMQERGNSAATVSNDLSEMSAVWKWAIAHGHATENPFSGILPPKKARRRKATRRPFTDAEAVLILSSARKERGALRWLPWALAATGARLSEVCQSTKADIITREGHPFLRIHAEVETRSKGEAQRSVKNEGSERMVPIHSALAAEGFLAYVAGLPAASPLFPT